jgi:Cu/Ag efflux protein CusF
MLKRSCNLLTFFLLAIALAHAGEKEAKPRQMIQGTIEKIDPSVNKLTVKTEKKAELMEFNLNQSVYVWTKGKTLTTESLAAGDQVSVYYDVATNTVQKIFVKPKK